MSGFLLDTNVVCEPSRPQPNAAALHWLASVDESTLYLSAVTIGEIRAGIEKLGAVRSTARLETFLSALRARFRERILPFDADVAERWGRLVGGLASRGVRLPAIDSIVAATALQHDLTLVTRNVKDFERAGVAVVDPFS